MKKYIHVTKETRELLEKTFGVTGTMVWYALSFNPSRGQSDLAKRIRKAALEHRGILMADECVVENTLFDADGYFRNYPTFDTMLEFSREDGGCDVFHKGKKVRHYDNVAMADIDDIQAWAKALR